VRFHQLHISLVGVEPAIWRRVNVPSHATLEELYRVIQAAMGWLDRHVHAFEIEGRRYELQGREPDPPVTDERMVRLFGLPVGSRFTYEYDLAKEWVHEIVVESTHESDDNLALCVDGARACPPEDSGGASRYRELLGTLADPDREEHEETVTWPGGSFDPDAFRLQTANAALVALYRQPPEPPRKRTAR